MQLFIMGVLTHSIFWIRYFPYNSSFERPTHYSTTFGPLLSLQPPTYTSLAIFFFSPFSSLHVPSSIPPSTPALEAADSHLQKLLDAPISFVIHGGILKNLPSENTKKKTPPPISFASSGHLSGSHHLRCPYLYPYRFFSLTHTHTPHIESRYVCVSVKFTLGSLVLTLKMTVIYFLTQYEVSERYYQAFGNPYSRPRPPLPIHWEVNYSAQPLLSKLLDIYTLPRIGFNWC